ncbi:hypothetical protein GLYMA_19G214800v4 [Glycine max]|uniref:DUF761 domain-containing protein n=1 Tax=Glycine max TaxID=3847 RepID=I1NBA8_SOYBN|nr:uncharacterized protein LOC114399896 [Glycine soja]KAH1078957.1 hypothetical protein GYH30_053813 [Glycine max]KAG4916670.1 hypothetical protein JHK87_054227 [Glycine soja]KAH1078958.1 hypothetical protein GYH30_053813 [Glycine max]KAH1195654.1 hypothetical protein GmHk_19G056111 [Glycine max]KRG96501.1 hypothetical protein GLYMA_19G214800v4 [Glycine max]
MSSIMETQPECAVINIPNIKTEQHVSVSPKKKNGGGMRFLRVALFKMRGRSAKPTALQVDNNEDGERSKSTWGKFVGSMRPLHLQSTQSPRSSPDSPSEYKSDCGGYVSDFGAEEEPYSPSPPSSRYASAVGLNELVQNDEENEKQEVIVEDYEQHVDGDGDEMIDAKAEDFIAQFYQEMKLQRLDSVDRRYVERSQRSLGL